MSRLFISHSSANNAEAVAIRDWLAREGWDEVFLDLDPARGIGAGERWERALNEAASRCEAVLFVISKAWLESRWCLKEFNLARRLNKRLFGVLVEAMPLVELPEDLSGTWQVVDLAVGQDHEMFRVTLPRTHEEAHVTFSHEGLARLRGGLARAGLEPRFFDWPPKGDPGRPPYRGLKPLEAEDAGIFFGRDAPIVGALDALRGLREAAAPRLLVILGASGSGKSSFLRAGLLPRLARDDRNFLPLPAIRPEHAALTGEAGLVRALEAALAMHSLAHRRTDIRVAVAGGAETTRPLLQQIADKAFARTLAEEGAAPRPTIVIAVDQAEELFTADGLTEGEGLLALLRDLAAEDRPGIIVLFTIRSDSYDRLETAKPLEGLRQQTLPLLPMPRGAYQTVIEGPAARLDPTARRLRIEPLLTQRLLEDIEKGGGSDALPLLSFTLEQLYRDYGGAGALTAADYEAFGGIGGAIEAAVERALKEADADPRIPREREARLTLLRRGLIPWLAGIDPETGSPRRRIARLSDVPQESAPLIALLVEQRLLSTDAVTAEDGTREATVEPAHEALLRQWGLLQGWLEEDLGALTTLEAVKRAARDWTANARAADWLNHAGGRLEDAERVAVRPDFAGDLSADANDYLRQCREAEAVRRREREAAQARTLRLQRRVLSAVTAGLIVALFLAGLAGWQWRTAENEKIEAQQQRARAQHSLDLATQTANGLVFDVAQKFRDAGVPASVIGDILARARQLQDQLTAGGETSPDLRRSQAGALAETATTLLANGDTKGALAAATQARNIMQSLLAVAPGNTDYQRNLSVIDDNIGDVLRAQGDLAGALAEYREGLAIRKALTQKDPGNPQWQLDLAVGDLNVGDVLKTQGDLASALAAYREDFASLKVLAAKDPGNSEWQRALSIADNRVGDVLRVQGDLVGALAEYKDGLAIAKALTQKDPGNTEWQRDLSVGDDGVGDVLVAQGDLAAALAEYRDGLAIRKALAQRDPGNTQWQRDLSLSDEDIGAVLVAQGDLAGALVAYRDGLAIRKALAEKDPGNTDWQRDLSVSDEKIGDVLAAQGDLAGVLAIDRDSLAIRKALAQKDPSNAGWQVALAVIDNKVGYLLAAQGDLAGALAEFKEGLVISKSLAQKDPGNTDLQRSLSVVDEKIGDVLQAQGDRAGALFAYRDSLAIRKALAQKSPDNTLWQDDLSGSDDRIGNVLLAQGDLAGALAAYRDALAIRKGLTQWDPGNTGWQRDLALSGDKIGAVLVAQGDRAEALAAYRDSLAIRKALAEKDPGNTDWQRDLAVSDYNVGDVLKAQGDLAGALAAFSDSLTIRKALAQKDPDNTEWQRDLSVGDNDVGDVLQAQGDLPGALAAYSDSLAIRERLAQRASPGNPQTQRDIAYTLGRISSVELGLGDMVGAVAADEKGLAIRRQLYAAAPTTNTKSDLTNALISLSFALLLNHRPQDALDRTQEALALDPSALLIETNRAHALLFLGRFDEAKAIYLEDKDKPLGDGKTFGEAIEDDFAEFRKNGIDTPAMKKIEALLAG